jgi:hypothetical protein
MHWTLAHPNDRSCKAMYGHDPARGAWAELESCGVIVVYDSGEIDYDFESPLHGTLMFLAEYGFVDGPDIADAIEWLSGNCHRGTFAAGDHGWPSRRRRAPGRGIRAVLRIVENLRMAGG